MSDIEQLGLNQDSLIALALLLGCDYVPKGIPGVGKEIAMRFMRSLPQNCVSVLNRYDWCYISRVSICIQYCHTSFINKYIICYQHHCLFSSLDLESGLVWRTSVALFLRCLRTHGKLRSWLDKRRLLFLVSLLRKYAVKTIQIQRQFTCS